MNPGKRNRGPQAAFARGAAAPWWVPWPLLALVMVTVANYAWQVPYYLHFYGQFGNSPGGLTIPLLLTFLWFVIATVLLVTRRRGVIPVMASFLAVEAIFYLLHNITGAAFRDLLTGDIVLLIASLLGYVNALAAVLFLGWLFRTRPKAWDSHRGTTKNL